MTVFTVISVNAQNETKNGKVVLKTGAEVEGTIQMQGTDVIVTTSTGDVFYFTASEISKISTGVDNNPANQPAYDKQTASSSLRFYKHEAKIAYTGAKKFGEDINEFWEGNVRAQYYYERYRKLNTATWITGMSGLVLASVGIYTGFEGSGTANEIIFLSSSSIGCALIVAGCILPIFAHTNLKDSYQYFTKGSKPHAISVSAAPVFYAQGGAGIGIGINF